MTKAAVSVLAGLRLLVVEDEYMVADHIVMLLEDFGCDIVGPVSTIGESLAAVEEGGLDGALLDTNLDGDSSAPIAAALSSASVPFVVITGYGSHALGEEALDRAPRLGKPFNPAELERTLAAAFAR